MPEPKFTSAFDYDYIMGEEDAPRAYKTYRGKRRVQQPDGSYKVEDEPFTTYSGGIVTTNPQAQAMVKNMGYDPQAWQQPGFQGDEKLTRALTQRHWDKVVYPHMTKRVRNWNTLDPRIRKVIGGVTYNIGTGKIDKFKKMMASLNSYNITKDPRHLHGVIRELNDSARAKQLPERTKRETDLLKQIYLEKVKEWQMNKAKQLQQRQTIPSSKQVEAHDKIAAEQEWIGVDLDGTLAKFTTWAGPKEIGAPVPKMIERVKTWLDNGERVKIFTARASGEGSDEARKAIQQWCLKHVGQALEVTCKKDRYCKELWDDRARGVVKNTGMQRKGRPGTGVSIDLKIGDTIRVGRFKNKRVKVEEIGKDENGHPTVNGRKLLTVRIEKIMDSANGNMKGSDPIISPRVQKKAGTISTLWQGLKERFEDPYPKGGRDYAGSVRPQKYKDLEYSEQFGKDLEENIEAITAIVNGMGSPSQKLYELYPDKLHGMDVTPITDIHDYDYTYPKKFRNVQEALMHQAQADKRFYNNLLKSIEKASTEETRASGLDEKRRKGAEVYYKMLRKAGALAFLRNKMIEEGFGKGFGKTKVATAEGPDWYTGQPLESEAPEQPPSIGTVSGDVRDLRNQVTQIAGKVNPLTNQVKELINTIKLLRGAATDPEVIKAAIPGEVPSAVAGGTGAAALTAIMKENPDLEDYIWSIVLGSGGAALASHMAKRYGTSLSKAMSNAYEKLGHV